MAKRESIVAIIPARYGSTRLPGKPLVDLCGKPMIRHVYERAKRAKLVDRVIVATDDARIVEAVEKFGGEAVMTPANLKSGSDRVAHVARELKTADIIVNIQGDEPLIEPAMIDEAIRLLVDDETVLVGTIVKSIEAPEELHNPNIVKAVLDAGGFALYFSRSPIPYSRDGQMAEILYKHVGLYVYRRDFLLKFSGLRETRLERTEKLEQLRILENGYRIKAAVTRHDSIPVDSMEDVERVRTLMAGSPKSSLGHQEKE